MRTAMSYVSAILENGQMPSDELLAMAGLSREDAQRMIQQIATGAGNDGDDRQDDNEGEENKDTDREKDKQALGKWYAEKLQQQDELMKMLEDRSLLEKHMEATGQGADSLHILNKDIEALQKKMNEGKNKTMISVQTALKGTKK